MYNLNAHKSLWIKASAKCINVNVQQGPQEQIQVSILTLKGFIYLMLITDSLPEIILLPIPRPIESLNFFQTVDVFEGNLIGCCWSGGGPEESSSPFH